MEEGLVTRIDEEIAYLRGIYPALEYKPDGRWVRIPGYRIIVAGWTPAELDVCFQIADAYPRATLWILCACRHQVQRCNPEQLQGARA